MNYLRCDENTKKIIADVGTHVFVALIKLSKLIFDEDVLTKFRYFMLQFNSYDFSFKSDDIDYYSQIENDNKKLNKVKELIGKTPNININFDINYYNNNRLELNSINNVEFLAIVRYRIFQLMMFEAVILRKMRKSSNKEEMAYLKKHLTFVNDHINNLGGLATEFLIRVEGHIFKDYVGGAKIIVTSFDYPEEVFAKEIREGYSLSVVPRLKMIDKSGGYIFEEQEPKRSINALSSIYEFFYPKSEYTPTDEDREVTRKRVFEILK